MPQSNSEKSEIPAGTPMTVSEILDDYAVRRESLLILRKRYVLQPLIMHHVSFNCIRDYCMELLPHHRDVLVCFEHVKYDAVLNTKEVKGKQASKHPPHCIILQVKFIEMNTYLNVGSIGYMDFTDRSIVAECIKEYIEDCFRADMRVVGSCSSGQLEMMTILSEMHVIGTKVGDVFTYSIRGRGTVVHIFDPCWMLRKLKTLFCTHDVIFEYEGARHCASHENIQMLLKYPRLQKLLDTAVYDACTKSTASAAKTFSRTVSILMEGFYKPFDPTNQVFPEAIGTKIFIQLFDQLFDSFNSVSTEFRENKRLRQPLSIDSDHWAMWDSFVPMLESMRLATRTSVLFPQMPDLPDPKEIRRNKLRKKHCKSAEPPALPIIPTEEKDAYDDDEYRSQDFSGERDDELVKFLTTMLRGHKNAEDALPEYLQDASEKTRNSELLLSLARTEGLVKEMEKMRDRLDIHKPTSKHLKIIYSIQSLLNTITVYNAELRVSHRSSLTYEYISCKFAGKLRRLSENYIDHRDFYSNVIAALLEISSALRFLNFTVFQSWIASIYGMKMIFRDLKKHHCDSFDTRIANCDAIHCVVDILRDENGLHKVHLADETYGTMQDYHVCILALTEEFNDTITSTIFDGDDRQSKSGTLKKKKNKPTKKRNGANPQAEGPKEASKDSKEE